jgi:hypothetical protein
VSRRKATLGAAIFLAAVAIAGSPGAQANPGDGAGDGDGATVDGPARATAPVSTGSVALDTTSVSTAPPATGLDASDAGPIPGSACTQFAHALDVALWRYADFTQVTGTPGWSYQDPAVANSNVGARTALRQSITQVLAASETPGVQPEVAAPMRAWSLHATKLMLIMGLHGGGDTILAAATQLDADTNEVQMACMIAGTPAMRTDA